MLRSSLLYAFVLHICRGLCLWISYFVNVVFPHKGVLFSDFANTIEETSSVARKKREQSLGCTID